MTKQQFDVFLCHNSEDKPAVIEIAQQLRKNNLKPWLDVWELQPGAIWQFALEQQIASIGAAAVFAGKQGLGPWQSEEIYAFLQEFVQRKCPVIPVMLFDAPKQPELPVFLRNRHWVNFRLQDPDPLVQLIWGITGQKPASTIGSLKFENSLTSDSGIDYSRLRDLLQAQNFKDADYETFLLMRRVVSKERYVKYDEWIKNSDARKFPCSDIKTIDRLWVKHSDGKFGFSVQQKIYMQCGAKLDGKYPGGKILKEFGYRVGWRISDGITIDIEDATYNTSAPSGHLPLKGLGYGFFPFLGFGFHPGSIFFRLHTCNCKR
ncbi:MAG: GUN4 domain-containing protein [Aulosira sp. DedQUE10]|nr:GUN4 domain-containing protein [Aulosira sp. DedQUE10]